MAASRPWCVAVARVLVCVATLGLSSSRCTLASPHPGSSSLASFTPRTFTSPLPLDSSSDVHYEDYSDDWDLPEKRIIYTRVLFFCEYLYSAKYGSYSGLTPVMLFRNSSVTVVSEESFVNFCLPFYLSHYAGRCEEKPYISACLFDDVVFLHGHGCDRPSQDDVYFDLLLGTTLLEEDEACFSAVCGGEVRVVRREVEGHTVHLFSPQTQHNACHKYLLPYYPSHWTPAPRILRNVHWPFCFAGYELVWSSESRGGGGGAGSGAGGLIKTWSYLPPHCRAKEQVSAVAVALVVLGGVAGNTLVLVVSVWKGHLRDPASILCVSLATAELLVCLFVLAPALHTHLSLMRVAAAEDELSLGVSKGSDFRLLLGIGVEEVEGGFRMFSAHVLNTGCVVSLPTVLLFTVEQGLTTSGRSLREELTQRQTRCFVAAIWSLGVLLSLALVHGSGAFWYSFYKLLLSLHHEGAGMVLVTVAVVLGTVSGVTVVLSFLVACRTLRGWSVQRRPVVVVTAVLHLLSTGAAGAAFLLLLNGFSSSYLEGTRFLCWWGYLASACWHPWLLCLRRRHFREAAMALVSRERLPRSLGRLFALCFRVNDSATPSPLPSPRPPPRPRPKLAPGRRHRFLPGVRYYK